MLADSEDIRILANWVQAIKVYVMAVNRDMTTDDLNRIVDSVFPTQIEPGSIADRLLAKGREEGLAEGRQEGRQEGKLAGQVQMLQGLLRQPVSSDAELLARPESELVELIQELQYRLQNRNS